MGPVHKSNLALHCTLNSDEKQPQEDYEMCWDKQINRKAFPQITEDIYWGPQGAATAVMQPPKLKQWFQVPHSTPRVTLMIGKGHESHDLGPMVAKAMQAEQWTPIDNPQIHMPADKQLIRISNKAYDTGFVERVLLGNRVAVSQMASVEQPDLLASIPEGLWSQHQTDVGLVKSVQPVQIKLRPSVQLPYKRQYPLSSQAIQGIKPTIDGLLQAGVLIKTTSPCC